MKLDVMGTLLALERLGVSFVMNVASQEIEWVGEDSDGVKYTIAVRTDAENLWKIVVVRGSGLDDIEVIKVNPLTKKAWRALGGGTVMPPDWVKVWG